MSHSYDEDDLEKSLQEAAFRRGLRSSKMAFLNELKKHVLSDSDLRSQAKAIERAFSDMASYISSKPTSSLNMELRDFDRFGLSELAVRRIGQLAVQLESTSPKSNRFASNNVNSRSFSRQSSVGDEQYEEDFEELLDEEFEDEEGGSNPLPTPYRRVDVPNDNFDSDEDRNNKAPTSLPHASPLSRHRHRTQQYQRQVQNNASFKVTEEKQLNEELGSVTNNNNKNSVAQPKVSASVHFPSSSSPASGLPLGGGGGGGTKSVGATSSAPSAVSVSGSVIGRRKRKKTPEWITQRRFTLGKQIGEGSFGKVFEAMNDMGIIVAVKRMNFLNKSAEIDDLLSEIDLMRGLSHPNIVEYLGAIVDADQCCLYIFQEWVSRGSVQALLKDLGPFPPSVVRNYTRQILHGLEYLHEQKIVHRDIKGGNILVHNDGNVKLADFGASKKIGMDCTVDDGSAIKGTPYFMAPEVLSQGHYGRKGDIWAVGCTMIQMFTGEPPWKDRNLRGIMQLHALLQSWKHGPPPFVSPHPLPSEVHDCLEQCFRKEEDSRPTATELLGCFFLRDLELEDSTGSQSCDVSFYGRDHLEESATIRKLREEISSAQVSKSQQNYGRGFGVAVMGGNNYNPHLHPPHQDGTESDLIGRVDRQLQQQYMGYGPGGNNKPSSANNGCIRPIQQQQQYQSPAGALNNQHLPPPSQQFLQQQPQQQQLNAHPYHIDPFSPRDLNSNNNNNNNNYYSTPQTTARTVSSSEANTPLPNHHKQMYYPPSNNPFGSPARLISPTHLNNPNNNNTNNPNTAANPNNPFGRRASSSSSTDSSNNSRPNSQQATVHTHLQKLSQHHYDTADNSANAAVPGGVIRDSLSQLKRKVQQQSNPGSVYASAARESSHSRAGSYSENLSSQRDSEDLTPPINDYHVSSKQPQSGSSRRGSRSNSADDNAGGAGATTLQREVERARRILQQEEGIDENEAAFQSVTAAHRRDVSSHSNSSKNNYNNSNYDNNSSAARFAAQSKYEYDHRLQHLPHNQRSRYAQEEVEEVEDEAEEEDELLVAPARSSHAALSRVAPETGAKAQAQSKDSSVTPSPSSSVGSSPSQHYPHQQQQPVGYPQLYPLGTHSGSRPSSSSPSHQQQSSQSQSQTGSQAPVRRGSGLQRFDTRYFEDKQISTAAESKTSTSRSNSNSRRPSATQGSVLQSSPLSESVPDETDDEHYYRGGDSGTLLPIHHSTGSSNNLNSISSNNNNNSHDSALLYMQSVSSSSLVSTPRHQQPQLQLQQQSTTTTTTVTRRSLSAASGSGNNASSSSMRKSASTSDSLGAQYVASPHSSTAASATSAAASASRIHHGHTPPHHLQPILHGHAHHSPAHGGEQDGHKVLHRPYTSKASLASMTAATSASTAPNNIVRDSNIRLVSPRISPRDASVPAAAVTGREAKDVTETAEVINSDGQWICLKCGETNTNPGFCDFCATRRGSSGARGAHAAITRF